MPMLETPLQQVIRKLKRQDDIPQDVIDSIEEKLRLLEVKVAIGKLDKKHDRKETRAVVMLEYMLRMNSCSSGDSSCHNKPTWKELARAVSFKKPLELEKFQQRLLNYLEEKQTRQLQQYSAPVYASAKPGTRRSSVRLNDEDRVCIIPELSLKLAGHLQDPHTTANQAIQLLERVRTFYDSKDESVNASKRVEHLNDMKRFQDAYEASILYHVALQQQQQIGKGSKPKKSTEDKDDENDDNAKDNSGNNDMMIKPVTLEDLEHAFPRLSQIELKRVLPHIQKLVKELEEKDRKQQKTEKVSKKRVAKEKDDRKSGNPKRKKEKESVDVDENEVIEEEEDTPLFPTALLTKEDIAWRENILKEACKGGSSLATAANAVLRKYGLLENNGETK